MSSHDGRSSSASCHSASNILTHRGSIRTPKRRRPHSGLYDEINSDFSCPVCLNIIEEAYITKCGHTYCFECIKKSLEQGEKCPKCNASITVNDAFPNFLLNDLIKKYKAGLSGSEAFVTNRDSSGEFSTGADDLREFVALESQNLSLPDVNVMLEVLMQRKQLLEAESYAMQNRLLLDFLKHLLKQKREKQSQIAKEITVIEQDIDEVSFKYLKLDWVNDFGGIN